MPLAPFLPPSQSPRSLLTPPPSPRKQRNWLRDSPETDGKMLVEEYLYRSDGYRETTAQVPLPMPLIETTNISEAEYTTFLNLQPRLYGIFVQAGFMKREVSIRLSRLNNSVYRKILPEGQLTVIIDTTNVQIGIWAAPRNAAKKYLEANGLSHVEVDIRAPEKQYIPSLYPICPRDPAAIAFRHAQTSLLQLLHTKLMFYLVAATMMKVGADEISALPSVVVFLDPLAEANWHELREDFDLCLRNVGGASIEVEFFSGTLNKPGHGDPPRETFRDRLRAHPAPGLSISVVGETAAGSIGGLVRLKVGHKEHLGIITNSHVVHPARTAPAEVQQRAARYGCSYQPEVATRTDPESTIVNFLAISDVEQTERDLIRVIDIQTETLESYEKSDRFKKLSGGFVKPELTGNMAIISKTIENCNRQLEIVRSMPRLLGRTLLASGKLIDSERVPHDWAFVEFSSDHGQAWIKNGNRLPTDCGSSLGFYYQHFPWRIGEVAFTDGFSRLEKGKWYYKDGRGEMRPEDGQYGVCNGVTLLTAWSGDDAERYDLAGNTLHVEKHTIPENLIIGNLPQKTADRYISAPFCRPGDSGSFLIDKNANVAGLLYAQLSTSCTICYRSDRTQENYQGMGLAMSMDDVVRGMTQKISTSFPKGECPKVELSVAKPK